MDFGSDFCPIDLTILSRNYSETVDPIIDQRAVSKTLFGPLLSAIFVFG